MDNRLVKVHHSLTDWDYRPNTGIGIANDQYVSAPSSLKLQKVDAPQLTAWVFLKPALAQNLEVGRFVTYHRTSHTAWRTVICWFWAQALPPVSAPDNCYRLHFNGTLIDLGKMQSGVNTTLKSVSRNYEWNANKWYHYRVTWFTYLNADLVPNLRVIAEIEQSGVWTEKLSYDIPNPLWLDSETKLVGFNYNGTDTAPAWIDDTEVWGPA